MLLLKIMFVINNSIYKNLWNVNRNKSLFIKYENKLNDNSWVLSESEIEEIYKEELIFNLETNLVNNDNNKPIVIISDNCFTNNDFIELLKNFLWIKLFNRYCEHIFVDWKDGTFNSKQLEDNIYNNSFIVVWWSFTDVNKIDPSIMSSKWINKLKDIIHSWEDHDLYNNFFMWICFGHQFWSLLKWHSVKPGVEHFSNIKYELNLNKCGQYYSNHLAWISNFWSNKSYTSSATNKQYVYLDPKKNNVEILATDSDWEIAILWAKNWKYLSIQHHAELRATNDKEILYIKENLENNWVSNNYDLEKDTMSWNIGLSLYIPILTTRLSKINKTFIWNHLVIPDNKIAWDYSLLDFNKLISNWLSIDRYKKILKKSISNTLIDAIKEDIDAIDSSNSSNFEKITMKKSLIISDKISKIISKWWDLFSARKDLQELLFRTWFWEINSDLEWSVSRDRFSASNILWFSDFAWFIISYNEFLKNNKYLWDDEIFIVRELWPWDATLLNELSSVTNSYSGTVDQILYYWMWDKVYFTSIYNLLIQKFSKVPKDILQVFVYNLFIVFKWVINDCKENKMICDKKLETIVKKSIDYTEIYYYNKVHHTTMFWIDVKNPLFNKKVSLSKESIDLISSEEWMNIIKEIKDFIKKDPHNLIQWDFEKLLLSRFEDMEKTLSKIDPKIQKAHIQLSLRATSHLNSDEYKKTLTKSIENFLNNWWLIIDDWVHESFTFIVRLRELKEIKDLFWNRIDIKILYDTNTNYNSCVCIHLKWLWFSSKINYDEYLRNWIKIIDIDEMSKVTFFKVERYIRETIYKLFNQDYNKLFRNHQWEVLNITKFIIKHIDDDILNNEIIQKEIASMLFSLIISIREEYRLIKPESKIFDIDTLKRHSENIFAKKKMPKNNGFMEEIDYDKIQDDLIMEMLFEEWFEKIWYTRALEDIFSKPYLPDWLTIDTNRKNA